MKQVLVMPLFALFCFNFVYSMEEEIYIPLFDSTYNFNKESSTKLQETVPKLDYKESLRPAENEEKEAAKLHAVIQRYFKADWHKNTQWINTPIHLLISSENKEQAPLLARAFAMEIMQKLTLHESIIYATPENRTELTTNRNLVGTLKRFIPQVRKTVIIRNLKAFYDYYNSLPEYELTPFERPFDNYLTEIGRTRNIVASIHDDDIAYLPELRYSFKLWTDVKQERSIAFKPEIILQSTTGCFTVPVASKRDLIILPYLKEINFNGFYLSDSSSKDAILGECAVTKLIEMLTPFKYETLESVVKRLPFKKDWFGYRYLVISECEEIITIKKCEEDLLEGKNKSKPEIKPELAKKERDEQRLEKSPLHFSLFN